MRYRLVKLDRYSGSEASIYTIELIDDGITLFERFVKENINSHKSETKDIIDRLITIGHDTGAREQFFKSKEGNPGDGVEALYDKPNSNLRLYCIRYGSVMLILGGGGHKPKNIQSFQENEKLTTENYILRQVSIDIRNRMKEKDISIINDGMDFDGNLEFLENEIN